MSGLVVIGSLNADLAVRVPRLPRSGETITGSELQVVAGGKSANAAVAAARLGAEVALCGAVGDDLYGDLLLREAAADGIDVSAVARRLDTVTGTAIITVDATGENTIVVSPGANGTLRPDDVSDSLLRNAAVVCLCLEVPLDTVIAVARRAADATVVLNLSPFREVPPALLESIDVLILNEHEAEQLTGSTDPEAVRSAGVRRAVVTLGSRGAVVVEPAGVTPIAPVGVMAIDTTGCGDAFTGALAARLAAEESLTEAAVGANAVAAFAAQSPGAQASYPTAADLAAFPTR